jgi:hypothetical protein
LKYIFLDIDGVLNSFTWYSENIATVPLDKRKTMTLEERDLLQFDPAAVALLEDIVVRLAPDVRIIVSSTWRRLHPLSEIRGFILKKGGDKASGVITDKTPYFPNKIRGEEIKWFVDQFLEPGDTYVILDDDSDMTPEQKASTFVHTDNLTGLLPEHVEKVLTILG